MKDHFAHADDVVVNSGRGAQGLKLGKRMFAMFYKADLLVTLPPERVAAMTASGEGLAFDPGTGRPPADRILVPASRREDWVDLCEESRRYAHSLA